ncbi:uncharacterized protein LOC129596663 [Paramacrobiotus metropolitanus]|uniref:uncharacterized protein LOC129596663 n=1 Tax=Paramacrobiotus metropolitanus TaxID=2943436 RepID=UPI002445663A|nr:uncharacterized protein LOC129596663 [Paramacrobiotus metropolitanus]XP_055349975.1 uncharacterized protein LOC129596663 [Paramacrobiotus metropolitanus]
MTSYWTTKGQLDLNTCDEFFQFCLSVMPGCFLMVGSLGLLIASGVSAARFPAERYGLKFLAYLMECFGHDETAESDTERSPRTRLIDRESRASPRGKQVSGEIQESNSAWIFTDSQYEPADRDAPNAADVSPDVSEEYSCMCYPLGNLVLDSLWLIRWAGSWMFLQFPLAEFLLFERLQLPALLVFLGEYFVWINTMSRNKQTAEFPSLPAKKDALVEDDVQDGGKAGNRKAKFPTCSVCGFISTFWKDMPDGGNKTVSTSTTDLRDMIYRAQYTVKYAKEPAFFNIEYYMQ